MTINENAVNGRIDRAGQRQGPESGSAGVPARTVPVSFWDLSFTPAIQHRAGLSVEQPSSRISLKNTDGFWELAMRGEAAVVPQHFALFYVAWLLAHPGEEPI